MLNLRKRRRKTPVPKVDEMFLDHRRRVVVIKKKHVTFAVHRRLLRLLWLCLLAAVALILLWFFVFRSAHPTHADTLLYPQTCLGGWNHSEKAAGIPTLIGHAPAEYTDDNSASISNALGQIFCGGFEGDMPASTSPKKIVVQFSWAVKAFTPPTSGSASTTTFSSEDFASSTSQILDTPAGAPAQLVIPVSADQPSPDTSPAPDASPPPAPKAPLPPDPVSLLRWIVGPQVARAQEVSTTSPDSTGGALLEVLYTLDGTTWQSLGTATQETLRDATFEIPLGTVASWADLSQLQISVRTLSNLDEATTLYLDGIQLAISYEALTPKKKEPLLLQDAAVLTEDQAPLLTIHPHAANYTTSLILYVSNGGEPETWTYEPETLGFGDFLFSDYFSLGSPVGRYQLVEYTNDGQTFSCYGLSPAHCIANPHFISRTAFEITHATSSDTLPEAP